MIEDFQERRGRKMCAYEINYKNLELKKEKLSIAAKQMLFPFTKTIDKTIYCNL